jgi:hypothetical protein
LALELGGLEEDSYSNGEENAYGKVEWNDGGDLGDETGIKHVYRDDIWKLEHFTYDPKPHDFVGQLGPNIFWNQFPTMMQLFVLFWLFNILRDIVNETNQHTTSRTSDGVIPGGDHWVLLIVAEFKAWLAIWLYMGMKRQPNMKSYWMKKDSVFHCPIISKIMTRD